MAATKESRLTLRAVIEMLNYKDINQIEIVQKLKNVHIEDAVDQPNVSRWLKCLRDNNSQENDDFVITPDKFLDDKPRCGCPSSVVNQWKSTEAIFL